MRSLRAALVRLIAIVAMCASCGPGIAADLLGIYAGAAIGRSHISDYDTAYGEPFVLTQQTTAWQGFIGIRPVPLLGAEVDYIDFGHASVTEIITTEGVHPMASAAFGILYLPLGLRHVDVYQKVGIARLQTNVDLFQYTIDNTCLLYGVDCSRSARYEHVDTAFAYGAGIQLNVSRLGIRAEYQRVNVGNGSPDLVSLGACYRF